MSNIAEVHPEMLVAAEMELESLAAMLTGLEAPVWQGDASEGQTVSETENTTSALKAAAAGMAGLCRRTKQKISAAREILTAADRMLSAEQ